MMSQKHDMPPSYTAATAILIIGLHVEPETTTQLDYNVLYHQVLSNCWHSFTDKLSSQSFTAIINWLLQ